jgi:DNA-binding LacI/PurR family transcriptional regulator
VSRVLNDHPSVSAETRSRVQEAMTALHYQPSRVARALSRRRTGTIAVVVPFFTHPSAVERLRGVLAALDDTAFEVVLYSIDHVDRRREPISRLSRRDADGLLILTLSPSEAELASLRARGMPTVAVDVELDGVPSIIVDDIEGGRLAARHLLALGHERIGYFGDEVDVRFGFTSAQRRRAGFESELAEAGHPLSEALSRECMHDPADIERCATELVGMDAPPTAIFAYSDAKALALLEAASRFGKRVPQQVSIMGFDDIDVARHVGLTTVRQPLFDSGFSGAAMLLDLLNGTTTSARVNLTLDVIERRTTGPVKRRTSTGSASAAPVPAGRSRASRSTASASRPDQSTTSSPGDRVADLRGKQLT